MNWNQQQGGKVALAAQDSDRKTRICDRCFASVPVGRSSCQECGAPVALDSKAAEQSDSQIYTELARANLLRMRGDYKQAETECLKILRRLPNNASAHTLLGDIFLEKEDLEQAVQWYELSLDLSSDPSVKDKLTVAQKRILERDQAATAKELGLPAQPASKFRFLAGVLIPVLVVGIAAYMLGRAKPTPGPVHPDTSIQTDIQAPKGNDSKAERDRDREHLAAASELAIYDRLRSVSGDGQKILMVYEDPRTKGLVVSFAADDEKDIRGLAARLGAAALENVPDSLVVTLRGMRSTNLIYTAEVMRARLNETKQGNWIDDNRSNPNAWIDFVLSNEWSSFQRPTVEVPPTMPYPGNGTGGTPPGGNAQSQPPTGGPGPSPERVAPANAAPGKQPEPLPGDKP